MHPYDQSVFAEETVAERELETFTSVISYVACTILCYKYTFGYVFTFTEIIECLFSTLLIFVKRICTNIL